MERIIGINPVTEALLNKEKIKQAFTLSIPEWKESLSCYLKELF